MLKKKKLTVPLILL